MQIDLTEQELLIIFGLFQQVQDNMYLTDEEIALLEKLQTTTQIQE